MTKPIATSSTPETLAVPTEPAAANPALSGAFLNNWTSFLPQRMKQPTATPQVATPQVTLSSAPSS